MYHQFNTTPHPTIDAKMHRQMLACLRTQTVKKPGFSSIFTMQGGPGIGKNGKAAQFAEHHNLEYVEYMVSGTPSPDITGFMIPNLETKEAEFIPTKKFISGHVPTDKDGVLVHIQELDKMKPDQQAIVQTIFDSWLLDNIPVQKDLYYIASMNMASDNCGGEELIRSLEDRLYLYKLPEPDVNEWLRWAARSSIHGWVMGFLKFAPGHLYNFDPDKEGAFCSPRSWEKASRLIDGLDLTGDMEEDVEMVIDVVENKVGPGVGIEFSGFIKMAHELVPVSEVLANPETASVPHHDIGAAYAMCSNLATEFGHRREKGVTLGKETVENAITYIRRMAEDMAVFAFKMCTDAHPDFSEVTSEWTKFARDFKELNV